MNSSTLKYVATARMLQEIFPTVPVDVVDEYVQECDGNEDKAINMLINYTAPSPLRLPTPEKLFVIVRKPSLGSLGTPINPKKKRNPKSAPVEIPKGEIKPVSTHQGTKKSWYQMKEEVELISSLTNFPEGTVRSIHHENAGKILNTIVELMVKRPGATVKYRVKKPETDADDPAFDVAQKTKLQIPRGGRVQYGRATKASTASIAPRHTPITKKPEPAAEPYKYDPQGEDARMLREIERSSPILSNLPSEFFLNAMEHFSGDVTKVCEICQFVIEHGRSKEELPRIGSLNLANGSTQTMPSGSTLVTPKSQVDKWRQVSAQPPIVGDTMGKTPGELLEQSKYLALRARDSSSKLIKQHYTSMAADQRGRYQSAVNAEQQERQDKTLQSFRLGHLGNRVDLHGFNIDTAIATAEGCLEHWWSSEREQQEISGRFRATKVMKAEHVDPLVIITGRGIHSKGGYSRVRKEVKRILQERGFVFEESLSSFSVQGKRK
ncbi:hypothetical protein BABINDRAFT_165929 [Babjeviella inositovora NRRL Y-12698]|uniref:Smr domain-containing protein n=1 Tax=Babjeviella inositovora NRRL Y-12698 TaxID=984486 RepID=A0A1E3QUI9_9ASCO|nr:uncharacterized protein BABINDRAFT_165929 [Babjeviella inositovora NRRL Y-12698]ODQ81234.1 hypothetical protein BABINDRAFT_165929 [Babjeviella inositovora NRRL Y-12698]